MISSVTMRPRTLLFTGILLLLSQFGTFADPSDERLETLAQITNKFALSLYKTLAKSRRDNVFFSPFSATSAIAMPLMGAEGHEATTLRKFLHLDEMNQQDIYPSLRDMGNSIRKLNDTENTLLLTSKMFLDRRYKCKSQFEIDTRLFYDSVPEAVNFRVHPDAVIEHINKWAQRESDQAIEEVIKPETLTTDTKVVLVNIFRFKGTWLKRFRLEATKKIPFQKSKGEMVKVDLMFQQGSFRTGMIKELESQVLELPFSDERLKMVVLLPTKQDGIEKLENFLSSDHINHIQNFTSIKPTDVFLPRFKLNENVDVLPGLGTQVVLPVDGNVAQIQIKDFVHRVSIELDEAGSEDSDIAPKGVQQNRVVVKHPFMFYIQDVQTGCILVLGRVKDPTGGDTSESNRRKVKRRQRDEL